VDDRLALVVGQRIRRLRVQSGKSLRAQAREIGISASSLSALENSRSGISLSRLQRVAEHFGLHITDLLGEADGNPDLREIEIVRNCSASIQGVRRGTGVLYQLVGRGHGHAIQPYLLSFEPGGGYERDMIAHPGEEFAYVLQGEVEVLIGSERHRLQQGDAIRFRTKLPHAFRNASSAGVAMVIGAATPPW
jgi:XRE family transcriptional regulator, regulator of sulfur utilization